MRRLLIFLHGYEPRSGALYYKLYRSEAAKYAERTGRALEVSRRASINPDLTTCEIRMVGEVGAAHTHAEFHAWDAIARAHWARGAYGGIRETFRYSWLFLRTGHFWRLLRVYRRGGLVAQWPLLTILIPFVCAMISVALVCVSVKWLLGWPWWAGLAALLPALFAVGKAISAIDRSSQVFWVGRTLAFYADESRSRLAEYDNWKNVLAAHLAAQAKAAAYDEILVVGHSVGAALGVSIVGRALAVDPELTKHGPKISLLTLGQAMPVLGCLAGAHSFRAELRACALAEGLAWVDVTSGVDLACFHLVDPVEACGIERPPGAVLRPKIVSGHFHRMFGVESYARIKNSVAVHQLYLLAPEVPGRYDFFEITAGALPLRDRFCDAPVMSARSRPLSTSERLVKSPQAQ